MIKDTSNQLPSNGISCLATGRLPRHPCSPDPSLYRYALSSAPLCRPPQEHPTQNPGGKRERERGRGRGGEGERGRGREGERERGREGERMKKEGVEGRFKKISSEGGTVLFLPPLGELLPLDFLKVNTSYSPSPPYIFGNSVCPPSHIFCMQP